MSVWKFSHADGAARAFEPLQWLEKESLIELDDAAIVSWGLKDAKPETNQMHTTTGAGALGESFWGLLFGIILFVPRLGMAVGAAFGAMGGALVDVGSDDDFVKQVCAEIVAGTSAPFRGEGQGDAEQGQGGLQESGATTTDVHEPQRGAVSRPAVGVRRPD